MCTEFGVRGTHDCFSSAGHELLHRKCALSSVYVARMIASVHLNMNWSEGNLNACSHVHCLKPKGNAQCKFPLEIMQICYYRKFKISPCAIGCGYEGGIICVVKPRSVIMMHDDCVCDHEVVVVHMSFAN